MGPDWAHDHEARAQGRFREPKAIFHRLSPQVYRRIPHPLLKRGTQKTKTQSLPGASAAARRRRGERERPRISGEEDRMGEFDDYWARAYRGDSGVPHSDPQRLVTTWTGAFALGAAACVHHHASALASNIKSLPH
uniref:Uncharacterized protein n=2 Tax=Oryza TaxID=4527 RepID=A0A0E0KFS2_ORYPU